MLSAYVGPDPDKGKLRIPAITVVNRLRDNLGRW